MAKPVWALKLHYPMIQFLIILVTQVIASISPFTKRKPGYPYMHATDQTSEKAAEL